MGLFELLFCCLLFFCVLLDFLWGVHIHILFILEMLEMVFTRKVINICPIPYEKLLAVITELPLTFIKVIMLRFPTMHSPFLILLPKNPPHIIHKLFELKKRSRSSHKPFQIFSQFPQISNILEPILHFLPYREIIKLIQIL